MRSRAAAAREMNEVAYRGWFRSDVDPMELLRAFPALRLKDGYVLRAYRWYDSGNGGGRVWIMPHGAAFPDPTRSPWRWPRGMLLLPPKPAQADADVMRFIEGDGSALSYLSASLFARDLSEFGAMWHREYWSTCTVIGEDPWQKPQTSESWWPSSDRLRWRWREPEPANWSPTVEFHGNYVKVILRIYCGCGNESLVESIDVYKRGGYSFKRRERILGYGPISAMF